MWLRDRPRQPTIYYLASVDPVVNICEEMGVDRLILHGRVIDGVAKTWANEHTSIYWPPGYTAQFAPDLAVLDPGGHVRAREGDDMAATRPWHGLSVCLQSGGIVDVWEAAPTPT